MHRSEFLRELKLLLPSLTDAVNAHRGLLHFEVGELSRHAQVAMKDKDMERVRMCFALALRAYENGDAKLRNAIDVSFVEPLVFAGESDPAWHVLPPLLQKLYEDFHGPAGSCS